jgi:hypothetical protein
MGTVYDRGDGIMSGTTLSVTALFVDRDAQRPRDQEATEQLERRKERRRWLFGNGSKICN